jgi:hypothetical protein
MNDRASLITRVIKKYKPYKIFFEEAYIVVYDNPEDSTREVVITGLEHVTAKHLKSLLEHAWARGRISKVPVE